MLSKTARFHSLWLNNIPLCSYTKHIFIHASMDEHSGGFLMLAIGNDATVDIDAHLCHRISAFCFSGEYPEVKLLDHNGSSIFNF